MPVVTLPVQLRAQLHCASVEYRNDTVLRRFQPEASLLKCILNECEIQDAGACQAGF
jgi:hypothetical protein